MLMGLPPADVGPRLASSRSYEGTEIMAPIPAASLMRLLLEAHANVDAVIGILGNSWKRTLLGPS
jgi:hypothetical protein